MINVRLLSVVVVVLGSSLLAPLTWSQGKGVMPGGGRGRSLNRMYDLKTVETLTGQVVEIDTIVARAMMQGGVHLTLKTENDSVSVHLGPSWYLNSQSTKIRTGDRVTVTGSRISYQGGAAIVAAELKKGTAILKLRDGQGYPLWTGSRK